MYLSDIYKWKLSKHKVHIDTPVSHYNVVFNV